MSISTTAVVSAVGAHGGDVVEVVEVGLGALHGGVARLRRHLHVLEAARPGRHPAPAAPATARRPRRGPERLGAQQAGGEVGLGLLLRGRRRGLGVGVGRGSSSASSPPQPVSTAVESSPAASRPRRRKGRASSTWADGNGPARAPAGAAPAGAGQTWYWTAARAARIRADELRDDRQVHRVLGVAVERLGVREVGDQHRRGRCRRTARRPRRRPGSSSRRPPGGAARRAASAAATRSSPAVGSHVNVTT